MCYQTQNGSWIFLKILSSQHYPYSLPSFQNLLETSNQLSFFLPSIKTNQSSPTKKGCENKYSLNLNKKLCPKRNSPKWSEFALLKRRRRKGVKENPNSMAKGRFQCLVANGKKMRSTFSTLPTFHPNFFTLNLHFFLWF